MSPRQGGGVGGPAKNDKTRLGGGGLEISMSRRHNLCTFPRQRTAILAGFIMFYEKKWFFLAEHGHCDAGFVISGTDLGIPAKNCDEKGNTNFRFCLGPHYMAKSP